MGNAKPRRDSRTERVVHDIEERAARLRKGLKMLDQCISRDQAARRDDAARLRHYVDDVLANVARLERELGRASPGRQVSETTIMRAGEALAAAADAGPRISKTVSVA
jgi:hypothetical protein